MKVPTNQFVETLVEQLTLHGLEYVLRLNYGLYPGVVVDVKDPQQIGSVAVHVPSVHGPVAPTNAWFRPVWPGAGSQRGWFWPPEEGDSVFVTFNEGKASRPGYYLGGMHASPTGGTPDLPTRLGYDKDGYPVKRGMRTRGGHELVFDDTAGDERLLIIWNQAVAGDEALTNRTVAAAEAGAVKHSISLTKNGIMCLTAKGNLIELSDADGNVKIIHNPSNGGKASAFFLTDSGFQLVDPSGAVIDSNKGTMTFIAPKNLNFVTGGAINLKGAVFMGDGAASGVTQGVPLLAWLTAHTHTVTALASPTSPPIIPPPASIISSKNRVGP